MLTCLVVVLLLFIKFTFKCKQQNWRHVVCLSTTYSVCSVVFYTIFRQMYNNKTTWLTEIVDSWNNNNNFVFSSAICSCCGGTTDNVYDYCRMVGYSNKNNSYYNCNNNNIHSPVLSPLPLSGLGAISLFQKPYLLSNLKANSVEVFSSQPLYSVCLCIRFPLLVFVWPTRLYLSIHPSNFEKYPRYFIFSRK